MIELLQTEDLQLYKDLIDECFGDSCDIEYYQKYRKNDHYQIYVIKEQGKIVASATQCLIDLFTFDFQPALMIFNVAVRKECRKRGLGKELLEYIIEQAKANNIKSISLTCLNTAYPAHKLYESVGFQRSSSLKYEMYL